MFSLVASRLNAFLSATPTPMALSDVVSEVGSIINGVISWMTSFLSAITTTNGIIFLTFALSFCLFGIHVMKSLMGR